MVKLPPDHRFLAETLVSPSPRVLCLLKMAKYFERHNFPAKLTSLEVRKSAPRNRIPADSLDSVLKQIFRKYARLVHHLPQSAFE